MSKKLHDRLAETREEIQMAAHRHDLDELVRLLELCEDLDALIMLEEGDTSCGISALTKEKIQSDFERHYGNNSQLTAPCPKVTGQRRREGEEPPKATLIEMVEMTAVVLFTFIFFAIMWLADKG